MSEEQKELFFDLLAQKAVYGLDEAEQRQLDELDPGIAEAEFRSLEITAAAISMVGRSEMKPTVSDRMICAPCGRLTARNVGSSVANSLSADSTLALVSWLNSVDLPALV